LGYDVASLVPDFCDAFTGHREIEEGLPFISQLNRRALDYGLESLHAVDRYLDHLHAHADELESQQFTNVVLAAGCYVGEVMRRLTGHKYRWVNYADFFSQSNLSHIPEQPGTSAVLVSAAGGMWMPLNKIARYIGEGPENSTHWLVAAELRPAR
jgi:hypothetical protein